MVILDKNVTVSEIAKDKLDLNNFDNGNRRLT